MIQIGELLENLKKGDDRVRSVSAKTTLEPHREWVGVLGVGL